MKEDEFYRKIDECKIIASHIKTFLQGQYPDQNFLLTQVREIEGFLGYIGSHGKNFLEVKE